MKNQIIAIVCLFSIFAGELSNACVGEAQIISKIVSIEKKSLTSCLAFVDYNLVRFYSENQICPLDLSEVIQKGVEIGFKDGHDCSLAPGDTLTGVLSVNSAGKIILE